MAAKLIVEMGARIRQRRVAKGMSQTDLGDALGGISFQQVQKYENGSNEVPTSRMPALCEALDCDLNYLFGIDRKGNPVDPVPTLSPAALRLAADLDKRGERAINSVRTFLDTFAARRA